MKCSTSVDHLVRLNDLKWEVGDEQGAIKLLLETSPVAKEQKRLYCLIFISQCRVPVSLNRENEAFRIQRGTPSRNNERKCCVECRWHWPPL